MPRPCPRPAGLLVLIAVISAALPGRAELPPSVYADQQRRAAAVVELRVLQTLRHADELRVDARVMAIRRQTLARPLAVGQRLRLRYGLPVWRRQGWVGPSPVPVLKRGQQVTAWLDQDAADGVWFHPAAGGVSFGPSMESLPGGTP